ncbi:hypothetical protein DPMN_166459 [Dreissena polymorpha]|uniref:Uncharacterized protein n=1 Tax=Dreissena polymorpha TaxID=45954 RepID=A0A9D4EXZ9_DREPO|nr:hypothetical protein DPMN_166459 [Dreissena polymorpha]
MEWNAFIAASFYREEVVGSAESKDTLGLIGMNFNQVRLKLMVTFKTAVDAPYCSLFVVQRSMIA